MNETMLSNTSICEDKKTLFRIEILASPVSANKFYAGMHWTERKRIKDNLAWLVFQEVINNRVKAVNQQCRVVVTLVKPNKKGIKDTENLAIMQKMITDSLVKKGIFQDDTFEHIIESKQCIVLDPTVKEQTIIYEAVEV